MFYCAQMRPFSNESEKCAHLRPFPNITTGCIKVEKALSHALIEYAWIPILLDSISA